MSKEKKDYCIENTFSCPECSLMYHQGDIISIRTINNKIIHDCDNCLSAIELTIKNNLVSIK